MMSGDKSYLGKELGMDSREESGESTGEIFLN